MSVYAPSLPFPLQTADKVAVEVLDPPADNDIRNAAVSAAVIPPGRQEDATLNLPAQRLIKSAPATVDGQVCYRFFGVTCVGAMCFRSIGVQFLPN